MAINVNIYSNAYAKSKTIAVDFLAGILADSENGVSNELQYYFKFSTSAKDTGNNSLPVKIVDGLDDLALGTKQAATDTANAYSDIKSMVIDYVYDYVNGHAANKFSTGVVEQKAIDFSR